MRIFNTARIGIAMLALMGLTACGNAVQDQANLLKSLPKTLFARKAPPAKVTPEQIGQALAGTTNAVTLYINEQTEVQFLMVDIQRNGPYQSFGSSSRQVIVMRDGMITATRGFGGDLMSVDEDSLLRLVKSRQAGTAPLVMRHLRADNVTLREDYVCDVTPGQMIPVSAGEVQTQAQVMTAECVSANGSITNTYAVGPGGQILSSRQWISETLGYMLTQAIRV